MEPYISKHFTVAEWDCLQRSENDYAYTDEASGNLATENEKTANLFKILDIWDWNPDWVINTTNAGYKSGYRTPEINAEVGGEPDSYHTRGVLLIFIFLLMQLLRINENSINCCCCLWIRRINGYWTMVIGFILILVDILLDGN